MDRPLKVRSELGGWKRTQTLIDCYHHTDQEQPRDALVTRHGVAAEANSGNEQRERMELSPRETPPGHLRRFVGRVTTLFFRPSITKVTVEPLPL